MFCHDTRPRFSITHSRTLITTNRNNQFFESIYIADLSPTDNFHLIHPPYVSIHFAIDQWKWKRKHFHKYVFVISKYLSTLFYSVLYSSITIDNSIKSNFLLYTPSWFSFHLSNHYRDLLFFSRHWEKLFNDPCVKRTVKNTVTDPKKGYCFVCPSGARQSSVVRASKLATVRWPGNLTSNSNNGQRNLLPLHRTRVIGANRVGWIGPPSRTPSLAVWNPAQTRPK